MATKQKVLVANDSLLLQNMIKAVIGEKFEVLQAFTVAELEEVYRNNKDVIIIVLDGSLEDPNKVDTLPFVGKVCGEYKGILLAASQKPDSNEQLVIAGCHYSISSSGQDPVSNLIPTIKKLLAIK